MKMVSLQIEDAESALLKYGEQLDDIERSLRLQNLTQGERSVIHAASCHCMNHITRAVA